MNWYERFKLASAMTLGDALQAFSLSSVPTSIEELKKLRNDLIRKHHPDLGGSADQSAKINNAFKILEKNLSYKSNFNYSKKPHSGFGDYSDFDDFKEQWKGNPWNEDTSKKTNPEDAPWRTDPKDSPNFGQDRKDANFCKKEVYEESIEYGDVKNYTFFIFDEVREAGAITFKTNELNFAFSAQVAREWSGVKNPTIVTHIENNTYLVIYIGRFLIKKSITIEDNINNNPSNSKEFLQKLKKLQNDFGFFNRD